MASWLIRLLTVVSRPREPRPGRLRSVAAEIFGERRAPNMHAVACAVPRLRRTMLAGATYPLADLVAASSAVPGVLAPHRVDGTLYVDGGVRSMASADLAPRAENLLVMAPIAGPMFGPAGRHAERNLTKEVGVWKAIGPSPVWPRCRPTCSISTAPGAATTSPMRRVPAFSSVGAKADIRRRADDPVRSPLQDREITCPARHPGAEDRHSRGA